jgi:biotin synthase
LQALCFLAGANSIFYGEKLLTTGNPDTERDMALFARLGLRPMQVTQQGTTVHADIVETVDADPSSVSLRPTSPPCAA